MTLKPSLPRINHSHPLARGLVTAYPFFEGGGNKSLIDVVRRNDGTQQTAPSWVVSEYGHALSFNGSSTYISMPAILSDADTELSVAMLVKADTNSTLYRVINYNNEGVYWIFRINGTVSGGAANNTVEWLVYDGSNITVNSNAFTTTNWLWLIGTAQENGNIELFIDGESQGTSAIGTFSTVSNPGRNIGVARDTSFGGWFAGDIADIRIWKRKISAVEARSIQNDPWSLYRPSVVEDFTTSIASVPLGEVSVTGRIDAVSDFGTVTTKTANRAGLFSVRVTMDGSITKDFRNVQTFAGAMGIVAELDGVVSTQFTREREGRIDIVAEFNSPVTFQKMKTGQLDAVVEMVAEKSEGDTPVTDQDIGEAIVFRVPKIDYVFRAKKHPTGRTL